MSSPDNVDAYYLCVPDSVEVPIKVRKPLQLSALTVNRRDKKLLSDRDTVRTAKAFFQLTDTATKTPLLLVQRTVRLKGRTFSHIGETTRATNHTSHSIILFTGYSRDTHTHQWTVLTVTAKCHPLRKDPTPKLWQAKP